LRHIITVLLTTTLLFTPTVSSAEEENSVSFRARLLIHHEWSLRENLGIRVHFIPAPNLIGEFSPLVYLGLGWQVSEHLNIEPVVGWNLGIQEPVLSVRITPTIGNAYAWIDLEIMLPSLRGYWFFQAQYKLRPWLHIGFEYEGWGNYKDRSTQSHGVGPNILLRSEHLGLDLTIHIRENSVDPFIRLHLFL
jgi:hypothetical protein